MDDEYVWLAGWYATRLHAVRVTEVERHRKSGMEFRSECGAWVMEGTRTEWAKRIEKGIPHCKHCERKIKNAPTSES